MIHLLKLNNFKTIIILLLYICICFLIFFIYTNKQEKFAQPPQPTTEPELKKIFIPLREIENDINWYSNKDTCFKCLSSDDITISFTDYYNDDLSVALQEKMIRYEDYFKNISNLTQTPNFITFRGIWLKESNKCLPFIRVSGKDLDFYAGDPSYAYGDMENNVYFSIIFANDLPTSSSCPKNPWIKNREPYPQLTKTKSKLLPNETCWSFMSRACESSFQSDNYMKCINCLENYEEELKRCLSREKNDPEKYNINIDDKHFTYLTINGMKSYFCQNDTIWSEDGLNKTITHKIKEHNW